MAALGLAVDERQSNRLPPRLRCRLLYLRELHRPELEFERGGEPQEVLGKRLAELGRIVAPEETAKMPKVLSVGRHQLPQAKECQDGKHDYDGSNDPNDVVHDGPHWWHAGGLRPAIWREGPRYSQQSPPARRHILSSHAAVAARTWLRDG